MNATVKTVIYNSSVKTAAGWRAVTIKAECECISEKMLVVSRVIEIDGQAPAKNASRTGANRLANAEAGKKKRLSACDVVA